MGEAGAEDEILLEGKKCLTVCSFLLLGRPIERSVGSLTFDHLEQFSQTLSGIGGRPHPETEEQGKHDSLLSLQIDTVAW